MKKVILFVLMIVLANVAFAKEYHWGTETHWNNNYPEVVKTMPTVKNFLKECKINIKNVEFVDIDKNDQKTVDNVIKYAQKIATEHPKMGQFIFFDDVSKVFIIVNFDISETTGENAYVGLFAQKLLIKEVK